MNDWKTYDYWGESKLKKPHSNIRMSEWNTKDGTVVFIGDMTDKHLLNAYKMFGDEDLFKEMVVRLFEEKIKERNT
jgi:hypothetical protein